MPHPRALLNFHGRQHAQRFVLIGDDLERRGGIAREHAPASLQFLAHGSLQRIAVGVEIIAGRHHIAVERTGLCAIEQRQRIGPAVEFERHLAQANEIGAAGQPPQRGQQIAPQRARRLGIARRGGTQQRRVVIGQIEIGEFDDPDAVLRSAGSAATSATGSDVAASETIAINGSTPSTAGKRLVPRIEPTAILEQRRCADIVASAPRPVSSRERTRRGIRPCAEFPRAPRLPVLCRQHRHCQSDCLRPPSADR